MLCSFVIAYASPLMPPLQTGSREPVWSACSQISGHQQRLDRTAFVHRAVAFRHLIERQRQVEDLAGVDLPAQNQVDQVGQVAAHGGGATVQVHAGEEQLHARQFDAVGDADVADVPTGARGADGLHHRFLSADRLDHRVGAEAAGHVLDLGRRLRRRARSRCRSRRTPARASGAILVTAHHDDALGAQLLGGQHGKQADRAVANDRDRLAGPAAAASAANQPVPSTSEVASRLGIRSSDGSSGVATSVPSASGTRR